MRELKSEDYKEAIPSSSKQGKWTLDVQLGLLCDVVAGNGEEEVEVRKGSLIIWE